MAPRRGNSAKKSKRSSKSEKNISYKTKSVEFDEEVSLDGSFSEDKPKAKKIKQIPHTIESKRQSTIKDFDPSNEEMAYEIENDCLADYYKGNQDARLLITTSDRQPNKKVLRFCRELSRVFPNAKFVKRRKCSLKLLIKAMESRGYTQLMVVDERLGRPDELYLSHLPAGPTLCFRIVRYKTASEIGATKEFTEHHPEIVLTNFTTQIGQTVARTLGTLVSKTPDYEGRRVVAFHNQRDFVFFRHYRYVFREPGEIRRVGFRELGPQMTLKLLWVQEGTFDSKYGEYIWMLKRHEMEKNRKKFQL